MTDLLTLAAGSMLDCDGIELLDCAASAGFDGVGLRLSREHGGSAPRDVRLHAAGLGMVIHDAEVHRFGADGDGIEILDRAEAVGARRVLVVSDLADRSATLRALARFTTSAAERSLEVGLEYMAWTDPSTPIDAMAMAEQVGCSVVVDLLHHVRAGAGPAEIDAVVSSGTLGWVQLCDAPAASADDGGTTELIREARHGRCAPGEGALPIGDLLDRLPADVDVSVEVQSDLLLETPPPERARLLFESARRTLGTAREPRDGSARRPGPDTIPGHRPAT